MIFEIIICVLILKILLINTAILQYTINGEGSALHLRLGVCMGRAKCPAGSRSKDPGGAPLKIFKYMGIILVKLAYKCITVNVILKVVD